MHQKQKRFALAARGMGMRCLRPFKWISRDRELESALGNVRDLNFRWLDVWAFCIIGSFTLKMARGVSKDPLLCSSNAYVYCHKW